MSRNYSNHYCPTCGEGVLDESQEELLEILSIVMQIYNISQAHEQDKVLLNISYAIEKLNCRLDEIESRLKKIQRHNERSVYNA